jgi:hypothetical protein
LRRYSTFLIQIKHSIRFQLLCIRACTSNNVSPTQGQSPLPSKSGLFPTRSRPRIVTTPISDRRIAHHYTSQFNLPTTTVTTVRCQPRPSQHRQQPNLPIFPTEVTSATNPQFLQQDQLHNQRQQSHCNNSPQDSLISSTGPPTSHLGSSIQTLRHRPPTCRSYEWNGLPRPR